uniref:Transmembrane protein 199 n=1 Tax=Ciona intestinalis TaxID=7719 RepID=H2Y286_CIOIN|nr:Zn-finger (U1-like)-1 isoform X1 [Ciona intestinalis]|eukprot:XP_026692009.1 Zn-finger (U1-like)-1 isoform X1 [Ciona intestinalis]
MGSELKVKFTPSSWEKLKLFALNEELPAEVKNEINCEENFQLSIKTVIQFSRWKCKNQSLKPCLSEIFCNSDLILPELEKPPSNPELEKRLKKLRAAEENYRYKNMVSNITTPTGLKSGSKAPVISGLNFAVTMIATVFATTFILKSLVPNLMLRVGIGVAAATVLLCIEIFLAIRGMEKSELELKEHKQNLEIRKSK